MGYNLIRSCLEYIAVKSKGVEMLSGCVTISSQFPVCDPVGGHPDIGTYQQLSEALLSFCGISDSAALKCQSTFVSRYLLSTHYFRMSPRSLSVCLFPFIFHSKTTHWIASSCRKEPATEHPSGTCGDFNMFVVFSYEAVIPIIIACVVFHLLRCHS